MLLNTTKISPAAVDVQIGEFTLMLRPANIVSAERLFSCLDEIDLENLVQPIAGTISAIIDTGSTVAANRAARQEMLNDNVERLDRVQAIDDDLAAGSEDEAALLKEREDLMDQIHAQIAAVDEATPAASYTRLIVSYFEENGADVIRKVKPILGRQFIPAIRNAVLAVMDTVETYRALTAASGGPLHNDCAFDSDPDGCFLGSSAVRAFIKENMRLEQGIEILAAAVKVNDLGGALGKFVGALMPGGQTAAE